MINFSKSKLFLPLLLFALLSCSENNQPANEVALTDAKEKKVSKPSKTKKKPKKKSTIAGKPKKEEPPYETRETANSSPNVSETNTMIRFMGDKINNYVRENDFNNKYCFLVDMSLPSGKNRFFVYDLEKEIVVNAGLVAHGSCNQTYLSHPKFSNSANSGCSSLGKYKVGEFYKGKYGKSFRLYGLDKSNSNAFSRAVVIHGYDCVPDSEIYPRVLCNSFGCVMVSYNFFDRVSRYISKSDKPILLWVYG